MRVPKSRTCWNRSSDPPAARRLTEEQSARAAEAQPSLVERDIERDQTAIVTEMKGIDYMRMPSYLAEEWSFGA